MSEEVRPLTCRDEWRGGEEADAMHLIEQTVCYLL